MEQWVSFVFGSEKEADVRLLERVLDYCIGEEVEEAVRILPSIRPKQLRRLCLFLAGLSDKEVARLTGDETVSIRVSRLRFRRALAASGKAGLRLALRLSRRRKKYAPESVK